MVPEFYEGREIFVTGGSGVVGRALIEKLLRSCNVSKMYVLLRPKKNATIKARLEELKRELIFRRLMIEKPNEFDEKVVAIPGDAEQPLLGITPECLKVMENISIVFHGAATVRFDEPLKNAIRLNVGGTLEALKFAETLKQLEVFMHVSTFYSNPYLEYVENKWYEAPMDWKLCLGLSGRNDIPEEMLNALTQKCIVGFANTYCFTKNLAESVVNDYRHKLPVVIYRPSIVVFSSEDPEPGFPTNLTGAMAVFALSGAGLIKTANVAKEQRMDFAPQDIVIKCMAYYALKSASIYAEGRPAEIPVFHTSMCTHMLLSFPKQVGVVMDHGLFEEAAFEKNFLLPGVTFTESRFVYIFLFLCKQLIPAFLADLLLVLSGRKPTLVKIQRKIFHMLNVTRPFSFNTYQSSGITYAEEMIEVLDRTEFHMNFLRISRSFYTNVSLAHDMVYKVREVLFKEDPSTLPRTRRIMQAKKLLYKTLQIFLAYKLYHMVMPKIFEWQWMDMDHVNFTDHGAGHCIQQY